MITCHIAGLGFKDFRSFFFPPPPCSHGEARGIDQCRPQGCTLSHPVGAGTQRDGVLVALIGMHEGMMAAGERAH